MSRQFLSSHDVLSMRGVLAWCAVSCVSMFAGGILGFFGLHVFVVTVGYFG